MDERRYMITFDDVSAAEANRYAQELRNALLDSSPDIKVDRKREDAYTQDFGATLILVLGTPAAIAVAKAIGDWLKLRNSASLTIKNSKGQATAKNITSRDAAELFKFFLDEK